MKVEALFYALIKQRKNKRQLKCNTSNEAMTYVVKFLISFQSIESERRQYSEDKNQNNNIYWTDRLTYVSVCF